MEEKKTTEIIKIESPENEKTEEDMVIKLSKVYQFEGDTISQIDMSGLENITANDMIKANKVLTNSGVISVLPENDLQYTLIVAAGATGIPVEFFKGLAPKDAMKVKNKVTHFFFGED